MRFLVWTAAAVFASAAPAGKPAKPGAAPESAAGRPRVLIAAFSGVVSPVAAEFVAAALARARRDSCSAFVLELDTPGGLDLSMREIVKEIMASPVPVIVYVFPAGARAASAGVFITMAAHVAAMTPGTNIGAAHPVQLGGQPGGKDKGKEDKPDPVMESKITNDAAAYLQAIAARRGRNADWASRMVVQSTSVTSAEAVRLGIVDFEAESLDKLLAALDGRRLPDFPGRALRTKGAALYHFEMTGRQRLLAAVSDPNIAMILMTLGLSGILIELYSPGLILPGIVGAVSLILAFYSFQTLSANYAGLLLILLGFLLYILELKIASFGLLALSGTAALLFGATMLFKDAGGGLAVSWGVVGATIGTTLAVMGALLCVVKQALGRRVQTGAEALAGSRAEVVSALDPAGTVSLGGELWRARSLEGTIAPGVEVVVVNNDGLTLSVRRSAV